MNSEDKVAKKFLRDAPSDLIGALEKAMKNPEKMNLESYSQIEYFLIGCFPSLTPEELAEVHRFFDMFKEFHAPNFPFHLKMATGKRLLMQMDDYRGWKKRMEKILEAFRYFNLHQEDFGKKHSEFNQALKGRFICVCEELDKKIQSLTEKEEILLAHSSLLEIQQIGRNLGYL